MKAQDVAMIPRIVLLLVIRSIGLLAPAFVLL